MQVKTYATEGMIWMVGSTKDSPDYSVLYLDQGKVIYKCNLGTYIMDSGYFCTCHRDIHVVVIMIGS